MQPYETIGNNETVVYSSSWYAFRLQLCSEQKAIDFSKLKAFADDKMN